MPLLLSRRLLMRLLLLISCFLIARIARSDNVYNFGFYRTQGTEILDPQGQPFKAKGICASGWLVIESYALHLNQKHENYLDSQSSIQQNIVRLLGNDTEAEATADAFWSDFTNNFMTERDVRVFAAMGFNSLRLPFNYRLLSPEDQPGVYLEEGFELLDRVIGWCKDAGMSVLLDMHACPGGQSGSAHADPEGSEWTETRVDGRRTWLERGIPVLWEDNEVYNKETGRDPIFNQQRTADIWRTIAERYVDETAILGYEIANEPFPWSEELLRDFFISVTGAIREVDMNHIVFVEGRYFASAIGGLLPPFDSNMVVAVHRYWSPSGYKDGTIQKYLDARDQYQVPFLLTESGENSNTWIYETRTTFEENNIGWFFWGWKKYNTIATAYEILFNEDYEYIIEHWRDEEPDPTKIEKGLMALVEAVKTENCRYQRGFFDAMLDPTYDSESKPYNANMVVPGVIHAVHFDVGNHNVAYGDSRHKNEEYGGDPWNKGWKFRNDGIDILRTTKNSDDPLDVGYYVAYTEKDEWLRYTVEVQKEGCYKVSFRVRSWPGGVLELWTGQPWEMLSGKVAIPWTEGEWVTIHGEEQFYLEQCLQPLELWWADDEIDIAWMSLEETECDDPRNSGERLCLP